MTPERADEINSALVAHSMFDMGLRTEPPPSLRDYGLREMIEAGEQVSAEDDAKPCPKKIRVVCADRMVAALFVLTHYTPCDGPGAASVANNERAAVFVIRCEP